jgi:hypothetical protein
MYGQLARADRATSCFASSDPFSSIPVIEDFLTGSLLGHQKSSLLSLGPLYPANSRPEAHLRQRSLPPWSIREPALVHWSAARVDSP